MPIISFEMLQTRLLDHLRSRIRNGEITERGLAKKTGVSQPHVHNLLKGVRSLTPQFADQLMNGLGLGILDLMEPDELRGGLFQRSKEQEITLEVPVLRDRLGPGLPWPTEPSRFESIHVPLRFCGIPETRADPGYPASRPPGARHWGNHLLVARLADDPRMAPILDPGDLVLLDSSRGALECDDPHALFATIWNGEGRIRWVRRGRGVVYLMTVKDRDEPQRWQTVRENAAIPVVVARAISLRSLYPTELVYDPLLPPRDRPRAPARRFDAS